VQAGLDFRRDDSVMSESGKRGRAPARQRPRALAALITATERAAHEEFVAEMGDEAVWKKVLVS